MHNSPDRLRRAMNELQAGRSDTKDVTSCRERIKAIQELLPTVKAKDEEDTLPAMAKHALENGGPACLARAGACGEAWRRMNEAYKHMQPDARKTAIRSILSNQTKPMFDNYFPRCKGKVP